MSAQAAVHILGLGIHSTLGRGLAAQVAPLRGGDSRPGTLPNPDGGAPFLLHALADTVPGEPQTVLPRRIETVVRDALDEAGLTPQQIARLGIFLGSSSLDLPLREASFAAQLAAPGSQAPLPWGIGNLVADVAGRFGIQGPQFTFNTACSSGGNALIYAGRLLRAGQIEHALVVGTELFNWVSQRGFASLMLLSQTGMRPFDANRDGMVIGEGCGAMLLSLSPPAGPLARFALRAGATSCDPFGTTVASAESIATVIRLALAEAALEPGDVTAIKLHGAGSRTGDQCEGQGVRAVFGATIPPATALKPYLGHTLGACGVLETACLIGCLMEGFLPRTPGFEQPDPDVACDPLTALQPAGPGTYLLNHFGFGGNNTVLVLEQRPA